MIVYHGSYTEIRQIDLSKCEPHRDFGQGFYVTKLRQQAEFWAKKIGKRKKTEGVVTEFDFDEEVFEDDTLKVLRFDGYSDDWLDFIVLNRLNKKQQQAHDYDIIEGAVANDDIAARVYDYVAKKVSRKQFLEELKFKTPSHQICFCTVRSLQALEVRKETIDVEIIHIDNDVVKSLMTDYGIIETEAVNIYYKSNTYTQLADETTGLYKKSWTDIYQMLKMELKM